MEKVCNKCGETKAITEFQKRKYHSGNEGYYNACKECRKPFIQKAKLKRIKLHLLFIKVCPNCNKTFATIKIHQNICSTKCLPQIERWKDQQYLKLHPEIDRKQYYKEKNKIKFNAEYRKKYYENNLEKKKALSIKAKAWRKRYKEEHFIEYCARRRRYIKNRITNDIDYRIKKNMRMRITQSVNGTKLYKHSIDLLGCSIEEVRNHIESQFKKGMTWDNWGVFGWHIDHIIPISSFDFTKKEDQYRCWHYTNLQPLWWKENVMKADNIIERQLILM